MPLHTFSFIIYLSSTIMSSFCFRVSINSPRERAGVLIITLMAWIKGGDWRISSSVFKEPLGMFPGSLNRLGFCQEKSRTEEEDSRANARNHRQEQSERGRWGWSATTTRAGCQGAAGAKLQEARAPHFETATTWEAFCHTGETAVDVAINCLLLRFFHI